jgi:protein phosphatase
MNDDNWDDRLGVTPYFIANEFPPPSATVQAEFGAHSRPGRMRTINDDHYIIIRLGRHQETLRTSLPDDVVAARFDEYGYALVVADGLGPARSGGHASHLAITTLVYLVRNFSKWNLRVDGPIAREIMTRVERFYRHVDSTLVHERRTGAQSVEQTTLTATVSAGRDLFFAHVGHSRAYLFRADRLMRLTRDHTIGKNGTSVVSTAPLVDVNAVARDLRHILTNTIGMKGSTGPRIDLEQLKLADGDRVLVCTNGLTDAIDELIIAEILATQQTPDDQCRALVDLAVAAGAEDDATALVAHYRIPS